LDQAEITAALGKADADRFFALYELTPLPDEASGPGVLRIRRDRTSLADNDATALGAITELAPLRAKLLEIRDRRQQPARDEKIVVSLNGLAIAGLARAGTVFGEPQWVESAKRAGEYLWQRAFDEKSSELHRYVFKGEARGDGFLDDYALLGLGFVALHEATGEPKWLTRAETLASAIMARFVKEGGVVLTSTADPTLIVTAVDLQDHDTPSGTSSAYALLAHLGKSTPRYAEAATKIMAWMGSKLEASPESWVSFVASAAERGAPAKAAAQALLLDSAARVKATAHAERNADQDQLVIGLSIDPGYHVNANPASLDYLIPTTVKVPGAGQVKIAYPRGKTFKPKFAAEGISVYEGAVTITVELPKGSLASMGHPQVQIEVQACTDEICLPPATISVQSGEC
jgi:uncharacterized protein YyaL (SSP411 family)